MNFLPNIFSSSSSITIEDIDSYISNISQNIDIQSNILELQEASHQFSNYICQKALPALFNALIQSKMNDDVIADIFQIINNCITDSEFSSSNALLIINYDLALPVIIDCINTDKAKKKIAVIQIITKLGILQPAQLQQHLTNDQDRLVHFLTLIDDPNPEVVHDFLSLLPILVLNNSDFQQLFSFNIMEKLMKLVENKTPLSISALRALLSANTTTQNLFFGTVENLSIIASLLESDDAETLSLFIDIFSSPNASNYKHYLKEANLFQTILIKSLNGNQQFIRLLGLTIKKEPDFCKLIMENDNLSKFLNIYLQSNDEIADKLYLSFFKSFLFQSDESCYALSELIITIDDRNDPKLITLATLTIMSGPDSKIVFLSNSPNFTSSMIGFFISHINFDVVLHFLIILCWESKNSCLEFKNEPSEPITFLRQFLPNESPLIKAQCCLFLRILHYVLDQDEENKLENVENSNTENKDNIEELDIQIRDLSTYLSTLEENDYYDFIRQIISIILNEPISPRINNDNQIKNETKTIEISSNSSNSNLDTKQPIAKEIIFEEEEEEVDDDYEKENTTTSNFKHPNGIDNDDFNKKDEENEEAIASYDQMVLEMKNRSIEEKIKLENELRKAKDEIDRLKTQLISTNANASADSELIQKQFDEFREQQNEEISRINSKNLEEKEIIERNYKNEIELLQSQLTSLQSNLDSITASSEKEISELKQKIVSTEIECTQKVSQMKNINRVSISNQIEELRDQCESMKRDLGILRSQHKALFAQQIEEFKDEQAEFQKIVEENKTLKFRISQLLKENEHFKYENQQLNEDRSNFNENQSFSTKNPENDQKTKSILFNTMTNDGGATANQLIVSLKAQINDLQSQNHSLLQKDSDNQREIANLQRENANAQEIRENWENYKAQLNQLKSENDTLKNQLSQVTNNNNDLQKTIQNDQAKIDDLSNRYSEAQKVATSVKSLVDLNCKLQNDIEKMNSQNVQMEVDLNLLKSRSSNKQLIDLMNQNSELKKSVFDTDQIRAQNSELKKTSDALKKDNSSFRSQILDFERKVARLETENNFLKEQAMSFTSFSETNNNNDLLHDLKSKIHGLNEQLSAIQGSDINKNLEQENNEMKQRVVEMTVKINTLTGENSNLKKMLKSEQQESAKLRRSAVIADDENNDINDTIESLTQNSDELSKKIEEKDKEIALLKINLENTQEQLRKQIKNDNDSREKEMKILRSFLTSNTSKFKILTDIKNRIDKESSRLSQFIVTVQHIKTSVNNNNDSDQLRNENIQLKDSIENLNTRIKRLTKDNTKLAKHTKNLTNKFRELSKENSILKNCSMISSSGSVTNDNDFNSNLPEKRSVSLIVDSSKKGNEKDVDSIVKQMELLRSERERQEEHIHSLIDQNKALIQQVAELNSTFSDGSIQGEIGRLREESSILHNECNNLKEKCRIIESEKFVAMQQKAAAIEQLRNAMSDLRTLQEKFVDLQEKSNKTKKKYLKLKMKIDKDQLLQMKRQKKATTSKSFLLGMFGKSRDLSFDFGANNFSDAQNPFYYQSPGRYWPSSESTAFPPTTTTDTGESATISPSHSDSDLNSTASVSPLNSPANHLFPRPRVHYQSLENMAEIKPVHKSSSSDQIISDNDIADNVDVESEIEPFSHFSPQEFLEGSKLDDFINNNDEKNKSKYENQSFDDLLNDDDEKNKSKYENQSFNDLMNDDDENKSKYKNQSFDDLMNDDDDEKNKSKYENQSFDDLLNDDDDEKNKSKYENQSFNDLLNDDENKSNYKNQNFDDLMNDDDENKSNYKNHSFDDFINDDDEKNKSIDKNQNFDDFNHDEFMKTKDDDEDVVVDDFNDLDLNEFNNSDNQNRSLFAEGNEPPLYSDHEPLMHYIGSMSMINNSDNDLNNSVGNGIDENLNKDLDKIQNLNSNSNDDLNLPNDNNNFMIGNLGEMDDDEIGVGTVDDTNQKKALRVIGQLWLKNQKK